MAYTNVSASPHLILPCVYFWIQNLSLENLDFLLNLVLTPKSMFEQSQDVKEPVIAANVIIIIVIWRHPA